LGRRCNWSRCGQRKTCSQMTPVRRTEAVAQNRALIDYCWPWCEAVGVEARMGMNRCCCNDMC
jgi:hypothetical protein